MAQNNTGYIYRSDDKIGLFKGAREGQLVSNPNQDPPWIIVHHSLDDTLAAKWPGKLFQAEVTEATKP